MFKALGQCWKNTYGRGAGKPVSTCYENEEKNGLLCYPKCNDGYKGVGPVCWQICPVGYVDTGAFCSPKGIDFFRKLTFAKKTYGRGAGTPMKCANQLELDGGLCYEMCNSGYRGVGPVCWKNCQGAYGVDCGAFCSVNLSKCTLTLTEMGMTAFDMLFQLSKLNPTTLLNTIKNAEKSLGFKLCDNINYTDNSYSQDYTITNNTII